MSKAKRETGTEEKRKKLELKKGDRVEILNKGNVVVSRGTVVRKGHNMYFVRADSGGLPRNYYRSQLRLMTGSSSSH